MGMAVSNSPKITPTRHRVRASIPLTPMPTAAAKFDRPRDRATSSRASMRPQYRSPANQPRMPDPGHGVRSSLPGPTQVTTASCP